ncbi:MAG: flagellar M-ring protein FliF [Alphaproteobacteria bacterium]|nr:flagellar M-ring protein FliF [Alphaproteobacteria bacterium]
MNSFVATLQQLGPARLGVMGAILLGFLMFFAFISMRVSSPEMALLYTNLSTIDSGAVTAKLEESQIKYDVSPDGSRILVPGDEVGRARMLLAAEGLPNGGSIGYEIFDEQSGFGTTNFVQNINQVRALEGELARTISSLETIKSARVHIVLPQRQQFSRETRNPSASVVLGINAGSVVDRQQIVSVQSLVASAVPNLKARDVSVVDSNGNLLAKGGVDDEQLLSLQTEDLRKKFETDLQDKIEEQVGRIVGFGKVTAIVTADMNFDRINTSEEMFNPEGQVLRSTQSTQENTTEREPVTDDVSVGNNLPGVGGDLLVDQGPSLESSRNEEVTNFEISKTTRNILHQSGKVDRLNVSVLVDGKYTADDEGNRTYEPRSEQEIEQITALVRAAIGYDEVRGDVLEVANLQFASLESEEGFIEEDLILGFDKADLIDTAEVLIIAIMVILVILLVIQPMVSKLIAIELKPQQGSLDDFLQHELLSASPANPALAPPTTGSAANDDDDELINIQGIEGRVKASTVKKVEAIVESHPAETVSVIRNWMSEE